MKRLMLAMLGGRRALSMSNSVHLPCDHTYGENKQETSRTTVYRDVTTYDGTVTNTVSVYYIDVRGNKLCSRCGANLGTYSERG